ncbi:MAG TPA: flagellar hook-associated protein FlgK [Verrucomicrobiae bacterium]|jgi:flagellar hook-associated protein 1 FlgK|nr:flagellar hook-associated protein FlgK [Verrucomicrobiae bacterium]
MLGLFGSLNLASRSLSVQQEATAVAGQNLANVNNPAYARQQLNVQTSPDLQTPVGNEGTGVEAISITEARDALLDNQIQSEGSVSSSLTSQQTALQDAETYLNEQLSASSTSNLPSSDNGLTAAISNLFSAFQGVATSPGDAAAQDTLVAAAQAVTQQFNSISSGLSSVDSNINSSITSDVAGANQDLSDIATLNQQIIVATASGTTANDLVDLRQQKLEDLASKVNVDTSMQSNGALNISIRSVGLVEGGNVTNQLTTVDPGNGQLLLGSSGGSGTIPVTGGSIGGNITARDGALASLQSSLDNLAGQLSTSVNAVYEPGFSSKGATGQSFFSGTTAATISVNSSLVANPATLQYSGDGTAGDNTIALSLAQLANQNISGLNGQTFSDNYTETVGALGNAISSVNDQVTNNAAVTSMLQNQRASVSGVSTDEEMTNLVQFQKAYQASAELITTLNEMLETVISMKTV